MVLHHQLYSGTASPALLWYCIPSYIVVLESNISLYIACREGRLSDFCVCLCNKYQKACAGPLIIFLQYLLVFYTPAILKYFIKYCNPQKSWQSRTSFPQKFWKMFQSKSAVNLPDKIGSNFIKNNRNSEIIPIMWLYNTYCTLHSPIPT